jgi:bifunctional UDP-N-acetylglucosamine pyrophosphorylase/glucosamine-1-phosphate N-acetyltransferase
MIRHIIETLESMNVEQIVTIISAEGEMVKQTVAPYSVAVQKEQLGTGHAVNCAKEVMQRFEGTVLVVFGDTPLITAKTFLKAAEKVEEGYAVVVLGFTPADAGRYGRLKMEGSDLVGIVEYKDASDEEKAIRFCNSGCMGFDGRYLFDILARIGNENAAHEYYLTDAVAVAKKMGLKCTAIEGNPHEVASANTREELAELEDFYKERENW